MWLAIFITVLAASGNNIGKVLQKQATRSLPRLLMRQDVIMQYVTCPTYVAGMAADLGGALLMMVAFAYAPVSVVQPVSAIGLAVLLVFSHFYLKERLRPAEWAAAGLALVGVLGLGASAEPDHMDHPDVSVLRMLGMFLLLAALLAAECTWRAQAAAAAPPPPSALSGGGGGGGGGGYHTHHYHVVAAGARPLAAPYPGPWRGSGLPPPHQQLPPGYLPPSSSSLGASSTTAAAAAAQQQQAAAAAADAVASGLEAGACFGLSAAACRTGFVLMFRLSYLWLPLGLAASVTLTTCGFVLQTRGLKGGNTVVVCTMAACSSMVSGILAGLLALGEKMPSSHGMRACRLASWALILAGVTHLAAGGSSAGLVAVARRLAAVLPLPRWLLMRLPAPAAVAIRRMAKRATGDGESLPVVELPPPPLPPAV